jgi:hypothetical protein
MTKHCLPMVTGDLVHVMTIQIRYSQDFYSSDNTVSLLTRVIFNRISSHVLSTFECRKQCFRGKAVQMSIFWWHVMSVTGWRVSVLSRVAYLSEYLVIHANAVGIPNSFPGLKFTQWLSIGFRWSWKTIPNRKTEYRSQSLDRVLSNGSKTFTKKHYYPSR